MSGSTVERYEDSQLYRVRHSASHVMAQAVLEMFPGQAKIAIGPAIENGFYYDFDLPRPLTPDDLQALEQRMRQIVEEDHPFVRRELTAEEARRLFADQPYKLELIDGLEHGGIDEHGNETDEAPVISTYSHAAFTDLCRGPHVQNTREINPHGVHLLSVAGAYWRGDENPGGGQMVTYVECQSTPRSTIAPRSCGQDSPSPGPPAGAD